MKDLIKKFESINVYAGADGPSLHKPLLILWALGSVYQNKPRLTSFRVVDESLKSLLKTFHPNASQHLNTHYPFGKLENDGIWEVQDSSSLRRTSVGHLYRSQLLEEDIHGGFTRDVYNVLHNKPSIINQLANTVADAYFSADDKEKIFVTVDLPTESPTASHSQDIYTEPKTPMSLNDDFIIYLNSLHNIWASGANALAESQAVNPYFGDLYKPFPLAEELKTLFQDSKPRVVILSGHAGDGKSTVALDLYKALQGIPQTEPLKQPLSECESIPAASATIVKDMSELSAAHRRQRLEESFDENSGSWLIVSNTGPLLTSLRDYAQDQGVDDIEERILTQLDRPFHGTNLRDHEITGLAKPLLILNLSRFDNTELGSQLLARLTNHPAWSGCKNCAVQASCPILQNRQALQETQQQVEERVRWLYRRVTEYDQRLTLRQMVAQLAFGVTGGMDCATIKARLDPMMASGMGGTTANMLAEIVFSESFFGFSAGKPRRETSSLRAIERMSQMQIGGPVSPEYDRKMQGPLGNSWVSLPKPLVPLAEYWREKTNSARTRAAQRRLFLLFGTPKEREEKMADAFIDGLLRSPGLRLLDRSRNQAGLGLSRIEEDKLLFECLDVLRESFSGFSSSQFDRRDDQLYLTLRRPDQAVIQPTQMVTGSLSFRDFNLKYDPALGIPTLIYRRGQGVRLPLALPLLDYIHQRAEGQLEAVLAPIHQAQLDNFHSQLLRLEDAQTLRAGEFTLLRADIKGRVEVHRYILNEEQQRLEKQR